MEFTTIGNAIKQTGFAYLGGVNISAKMIKNQKVSGNMTYVIYLAPANESGYNVCPNSTPECRLGCLSTSGRAGMELLAGSNRTKNSRINKTKLFHEHNEFFMQWLIADLRAKQAKAKVKGLDFSVRLNGTSDIDWQNNYYNGKNIFEHFPEVTFYDYTKNPAKFVLKPENYQLTFSYSGRNTETCKKLLNKGHNVAVVFNIKKETELPKTFMGFDVINGDLTDFRPNDGKGVIVGLKWKRLQIKPIMMQLKIVCLLFKPQITSVHSKLNNMNITAKTIDEFKQIEDKLQELPSRVYDQIVSAKKGMSGIDCTIDKFNSTDLYLPKKVIKICDYVDELVIITNDFVFRIKKSPDTAYIMCFID